MLIAADHAGRHDVEHHAIIAHVGGGCAKAGGEQNRSQSRHEPGEDVAAEHHPVDRDAGNARRLLVDPDGISPATGDRRAHQRRNHEGEDRGNQDRNRDLKTGAHRIGRETSRAVAKC